MNRGTALIPIYEPPLIKAADNVLEHVKKGCVSDPDPRKVQLFHHSGRTKDGLDKVRSARGSNRNEGYHQRLLQLLGAFNISPLMTHYISWVCSVCKQAEVTQSGIGGRGMANFV